MSALQLIRNGLALLLITAGLTACFGNNDDLDEYVTEVKLRPGGRIDPLPEITPNERFAYFAV